MSPAEQGRARVRVSVQAGELEVEGSEAFVATYQDTLDFLCERVRNETPVPQSAPSGTTRIATPGVAGVPDEFPEALQSLTTNSGTDQILVAGHYAARTAADGTFGTNDANKLLLEQAIKLSNPSQSMKNNLTAKRVFKSGSRWRISKTGEEHLKTLIGRR